MEHQQLSQGLRHLYQHLIQHKPWEGRHVQLDRTGQPLIHEILERVGALGTNEASGLAQIGEDEQRYEAECTDGPPPTPSLSSCTSAISPACEDSAEGWVPQPPKVESSLDFWVPVMVEDATYYGYLPNNVFLTEPMETDEFFSH